MPSEDKVSGTAGNTGLIKSWACCFIWDPRVKSPMRRARVECVVLGIVLACGVWFAGLATLGSAAVQPESQADSSAHVQLESKEPSIRVSHSKQPFSMELSRAGK